MDFSLIYLLDLLGVFAFSCFGTYFGIKKHLDLLGIFICANISAVGGGLLRDLFFNVKSVFFTDINYVFTIFIGFLFIIIFRKFFYKIKSILLILDTIGLSIFSYIGAYLANENGFGLIGILFFAFITGCGGGIMRDIILQETPVIFKKEIYGMVSFFIGIIFYILLYFDLPEYLLFSALCGFILRIISIKKDFNLPKFSNE